MNEERNNKKFTFHFWTSSNFSNEALELLEKKKNKLHIEIKWKNGQEIMREIKKYKLKGAEKMLNDYFFKNFLDKQLS